MALIRGEGSLTVYDPAADGLTTKFGLSRDWRPNARWLRHNCDWIEPLKCIAPAGLTFPRDMETWTANTYYNSAALRQITPDWGTPAASWQYMDGSVYASGDWPNNIGGLDAGSWCESVLPRFALHLVRNMPPEGQDIPTQVVVSVPTIQKVGGVKQPGRLSFYLPLAGDTYTGTFQFDAPLLHHLLLSEVGEDNFVNLESEGSVISVGQGGSAQVQGAVRETWLFEYMEDADRFEGGHILIRNIANMEQWWHYWDRNLRLASKDVWDTEGVSGYGERYKWTVGMAGAVQTVNLSLIKYGEFVGTAWGHEAKPLPSSDWNDDGASAWGSVNTAATDWTLATPQATDQRPKVTFTRDQATAYNDRPVLWFATEEHDAVIGSEDATSDTTQGDDKLKSISYSLSSEWKGNGGGAGFQPEDAETYSAWKQNAKVAVELGWQDGAGGDLTKTQIATCYIPVGGMQRERRGTDMSGIPRLNITLSDFWTARISHKHLIDFRQAGGQYVPDWLAAVGNRLGLPPGMIDCDSSLNLVTIPLNELPSLPSLAPQDGDTWGAHIQAVEKATGIRVGFDKDADGKLFADGGPETYVAGTSAIAYSLDYDTNTMAQVPKWIVYPGTAQVFQNAAKVVVGPDGRRRVMYWAEDLATRTVGLGDDWWTVVVDDDAEGPWDAMNAFFADAYQWQDYMTWQMPLRVDLRPDKFVQITDLPYMDITADSIWQIVRHDIDADADANTAHSVITAKLVVAVTWQMQGFGTIGLYDATGNDPDLDWFATGGLMV